MQPIGISLSSYFPWGAYAPWWAATAAAKAGYDFLQVLPVWGFSLFPGVELALPIRYCEHAWYAKTTAMEGVWKTREDRLLFPPPKRAEAIFQRLKRRQGWQRFPPQVIRHELSRETPPDLVEIHPDMGQPILEIAQHIRDRNIGLVLDTYHLRRAKRDGAPAHWQSWQVMVNALCLSVRVVHVQPYRDEQMGELQAFLTGQPTNLGMMLNYIQKRCPNVEAWVAEPSLAFASARFGRKSLDPWLIKHRMTTFRQRLVDLLK